MKIAVLGTGYMGDPMARNLAHAGHEVRAWNRTAAGRGEHDMSVVRRVVGDRVSRRHRVVRC